MTAYELFQQAKLGEATEAALAAVKAAPADVNARLLLCDLLCVANQLDRADRQLQVVAQQAPDLTLGVSLYRQLIRAETARHEVFVSGRAPQFMEAVPVPDVLTAHVRALVAIREDAADEAADLIRQADELRPHMHGQCDGSSFEDFRDLDDVIAPFLEVLTTTGKYYWVDWTHIESLEFKPPNQLRDLLWRPTEMVVRAGPSALVYVPVLYVQSHASPDEETRTGRTTEWIEAPSSPIRGRGQRMFLVGDESKSILAIQKIDFA